MGKFVLADTYGNFYPLRIVEWKDYDHSEDIPFNGAGGAYHVLYNNFKNIIEDQIAFKTMEITKLWESLAKFQEMCEHEDTREGIEQSYEEFIEYEICNICRKKLNG